MALDSPILIVEESDGDARELRESLIQQGFSNPVKALTCPTEAKTYLHAATRAGGAANPLPAAVILSLGAEPRVGFDFVRWVRRQPEFQSLVIIAMGGRGNLREVQEAYSSGANAYFVKGPDSAALIQTLRSSFGQRDTHPAFRDSTDLYAATPCAKSSGMGHRGPFLLVDDQEANAKHFAQTLDSLKIRNPVRRVPRVEEAISYLAGATPYDDRKTHAFPTVLFLDIRLPDSHKLLAWMEGHPENRPAGIIALTSSHDMRPVIQAYHLGVHSFLKQPPKMEELRNALTAIPQTQLCSEEGGFWMQLSGRAT